MENVLTEFYEAFHNAGIQPISDDNCCKLMAWVYRYGGANEAVVYNVRLNAAIMYAQKRLNIVGGEIPNAELFPILQTYMQQVKDFKSDSHPDWAYEICDKYNLSHKCIN